MRSGRELLNVKNLSVAFLGKAGQTEIVEGVNLRVHEGETVGLVGPTASGKTVTAKAVLGLLRPLGAGKPLWRVEGEVLYKGRDLLNLSKPELRKLRGSELSMISQSPVGSLNPILMIGDQTGESKEAHEEVERQRLKAIVLDYLGKVELPDAKARYNFFRDQFSGGEAQRINIASALICNPSLLVADEPTSNLDVTVQRQVLELLNRLKAEFGLATLLITHDLGIIAELSDYVYVIYAGRILEHGDVRTIFKRPRHPYTHALLNAVPRMDRPPSRLEEMRGDPPVPPYDIPGCVFHPRCNYVKDRCREKAPSLEEFEPGHCVSCLRMNEIWG